MTKDDLPPLPDVLFGTGEGELIEAYALAAIAAHDAKREKILLWRDPNGRSTDARWRQVQAISGREFGEYAWAYIEREEKP